jgi:site-specific DNA recombinase
LLNALKPFPPFQALVMSEGSRLGREQIETAYALKLIITSGVQVWTYLDERQRTLDSPIEKAMMAIESMADEIERDKARQRVRDAMMRKARAGYVTGGIVFGYDNVPILGAAGKRSHVVREINETQATVIRRMFSLSANGTGYSRISRLLNHEGAPAPKPKRGRSSGWSPSTVRVILHRRMYLGKGVYNQTEKRDSWGQKKLRRRPQNEWILTPESS